MIIVTIIIIITIIMIIIIIITSIIIMIINLMMLWQMLLSLMKTNFSSPKYSLCPLFAGGGSVIHQKHPHHLSSSQKINKYMIIPIFIIIIHQLPKITYHRQFQYYCQCPPNDVTDVGANKPELAAKIFSLSWQQNS